MADSTAAWDVATVVDDYDSGIDPTRVTYRFQVMGVSFLGHDGRWPSPPGHLRSSHPVRTVPAPLLASSVPVPVTPVPLRTSPVPVRTTPGPSQPEGTSTDQWGTIQAASVPLQASPVPVRSSPGPSRACGAQPRPVGDVPGHTDAIYWTVIGVSLSFYGFFCFSSPYCA